MKDRSRVLVGLMGLSLALGGCAGSRVLNNDRNGLLDDIADASEGAALNRKKNQNQARVAEEYSSTEESSEEVGTVKLVWPLKNPEVTSAFGKRGRKGHEGVDLRAEVGTPVYAAEGGVVLYSGKRIRGYGRLVVIRHPGGLSTVYAHNSELKVLRGARVKRGQLIALSGRSGHVTGPHLHFEVRKGTEALDPEDVIGRAQVVVAQNENTDVSSPVFKAKKRRVGKNGRKVASVKSDKKKVVASRSKSRAPSKEQGLPKKRPRAPSKKIAEPV